MQGPEFGQHNEVRELAYHPLASIAESVGIATLDSLARIFEPTLNLLHVQDQNRRQDSHRKHCSTYVQLSRLRSLSGLYLLQPISMSDIEHRPDPGLLEATGRLHLLQQGTIREWQVNPYN
jgi:hypothetical protein